MTRKQLNKLTRDLDRKAEAGLRALRAGREPIRTGCLPVIAGAILIGVLL